MGFNISSHLLGTCWIIANTRPGLAFTFVIFQEDFFQEYKDFFLAPSYLFRPPKITKLSLITRSVDNYQIFILKYIYFVHHVDNYAMFILKKKSILYI